MSRIEQIKKDLDAVLVEGCTPTEQDKDMIWLLDMLDEAVEIIRDYRMFHLVGCLCSQCKQVEQFLAKVKEEEK